MRVRVPIAIVGLGTCLALVAVAPAGAHTPEDYGPYSVSVTHVQISVPVDPEAGCSRQ